MYVLLVAWLLKHLLKTGGQLIDPSVHLRCILESYINGTTADPAETHARDVISAVCKFQPPTRPLPCRREQLNPPRDRADRQTDRQTDGFCSFSITVDEIQFTTYAK